MGCKADFAANSAKLGTAIGKKFNAADRPVPSFSGLARAARSYSEDPQGGEVPFRHVPVAETDKFFQMRAVTSLKRSHWRTVFEPFEDHADPDQTR